ncbi:MAG: hypothetical protein ACE5F1_13005 [Planctomycetota bacterium]
MKTLISVLAFLLIANPLSAQLKVEASGRAGSNQVSGSIKGESPNTSRFTIVVYRIVKRDGKMHTVEIGRKTRERRLEEDKFSVTLNPGVTLSAGDHIQVHVETNSNPRQTANKFFTV